MCGASRAAWRRWSPRRRAAPVLIVAPPAGAVAAVPFASVAASFVGGVDPAAAAGTVAPGVVAPLEFAGAATLAGAASGDAVLRPPTSCHSAITPITVAAPAPAASAQGIHSGANGLPNTSFAAWRTTAPVTRWRSWVYAPSSARSLMMLIRRGTPPARRCSSSSAIGAEDVAGGAGDAQAMAHVRGGLVLRQRDEVVAAGDALGELAQVVAVEQFAQLGLADQDDLQQLLGAGLEVRQQAHLLEHGGLEVVGLVDDDHDALALGVGAQQVGVQDVDEVLHAADGVVGHADAELLADGQQELGGGDARVEDQRDFGVLRDLREQRADGGGLAGADLAGELDEAAGLADAVNEVRKRLRMALAQEEIARVGGDGERLFVQPEERQVHALCPAPGARAGVLHAGGGGRETGGGDMAAGTRRRYAGPDPDTVPSVRIVEFDATQDARSSGAAGLSHVTRRLQTPGPDEVLDRSVARERALAPLIRFDRNRDWAVGEPGCNLGIQSTIVSKSEVFSTARRTF